MASRIQTLKDKLGHILPRTVSRAVTMEDGTNLEYAIANRTTDHIKLTPEVLEALGLPVGTTLSTLLINQAQSTNNVLAAAEVVDDE